MAEQPPPLLLTQRQVAAMLACSERTVWNLRDRGLLPAVRLGDRGIRFARSDVEALISRLKEKP